MDDISDTLDVTVDGKDRTLLMSFGLLNSLSTIVEDASRVPQISLDAKMRTAVLKDALAERKKSGKVSKAVEDFDDLDITIEHVESILEWVSEHTMRFFVRSVKRAVTVTERHGVELKALASSLNGLGDSASEKA